MSASSKDLTVICLIILILTLCLARKNKIVNELNEDLAEEHRKIYKIWRVGVIEAHFFSNFQNLTFPVSKILATHFTTTLKILRKNL